MTDKLVVIVNNCLKNFNINANNKVIESILYSVVPVLLIVPYIIIEGIRYNDYILVAIGIIFLIADTYMLFNRFNGDEIRDDYISLEISKFFNVKQTTVFGIIYMLIPAYIFAVYIAGVGVCYYNYLLILIGLVIFVVDNYHFIMLK